MKWTMLVLSELITLVCFINQGFSNNLVFSTNTTDGNGTIYEFNLDTGNVSYLLSNISSDVYSIAYDYTNGYIYFPRLHNDDIQRFQYPSKQAYISEYVISADRPIGIAIDPLYDKVYWTGYTSGKLYGCNLNGSNKSLILHDDPLYALTLDFQNRWLYYSTTYPKKIRKIRRCRLDGTEIQTVIDEEATGLSIDFNEGRLYWMNFKTGDLKSAYLDGTDNKTVFSTNTTLKDIGISILDSKIYCANFNQLLKVTLSPITSASVLFKGTYRSCIDRMEKTIWLFPSRKNREIRRRRQLFQRQLNVKMTFFKINDFSSYCSHSNTCPLRDCLKCEHRNILLIDDTHILMVVLQGCVSVSIS